MLEKEIKKTLDKILEINNKIKELELNRTAFENQLVGLQTASKLIYKKNAALTSSAPKLRPDSEIAKVREILREAKLPMHINEILKLLGKENDTKKKLSLAGSLASYVKLEKIFKKTAPNTFGLVEFDQNDKTADKKENNPESQN